MTINDKATGCVSRGRKSLIGCDGASCPVEKDSMRKWRSDESWDSPQRGKGAEDAVD
jgi:hypothetical protein